MSASVVPAEHMRHERADDGEDKSHTETNEIGEKKVHNEVGLLAVLKTHKNLKQAGKGERNDVRCEVERHVAEPSWKPSSVFAVHAGAAKRIRNAMAFGILRRVSRGKKFQKKKKSEAVRPRSQISAAKLTRLSPAG